MGFLKFCCVQLVKTILGVIVLFILVIGSTFLTDWMWGVVFAVIIAYIFLSCWWEDYEKQEFKKRK